METINIKLNFNYGNNWTAIGNIFVKGYLFDKNNIFLEGNDLIKYFSTVDSSKSFENKLTNANGLFSVIIKKETNVFVAVDSTRTFPLFYYKNKDEFIVTDNTYFLKEKYQIEFDELSKEEFLLVRYVTGNKTLLKDVFQIQAGEYLIYNNNKINTSFYHDYLVSKVIDRSYGENKDDFLNILNRQTQRLIKSVKGKTIVIPLSSGYDSRLLASLLRMHNYNNVVCFTYGKKDSIDVSISKKVAKQLGYKWYFVDYHKDTLDSNYINSKEFNDYYRFSFNHTSPFFLQDYFIVKQLQAEKLIPTDSIIVPGHSGDMLVGNHLFSSDNTIINSATFVKRIIKAQYVLKHYTKNIKIETKLKNYFSDKMLSFSLIDNFNLKERQAKYIVNSLRIYEYFGYQHRMPLWDSELVSFFKHLDFDSKLNSNFYIKTIFNNIFKPLNIDIIPPDKVNKNESIKRYLKQFTSHFILNLYRRKYNSITKVSDTHPYAVILNQMIEESKSKNSNINNIMPEWVIQIEKNN